MAKKSLKATLTSHQGRMKKNAKVKAQDAAQARDKLDKAKPKKPKPCSSKAKAQPDGTSKAQQQQSQSSTNPFKPTDRILLVGEGNFSFARALFQHPALAYLPGENVTATAYDSEDACFDKYPDARAIVEQLRARNVDVHFGVDATRLEGCKPLRGRRWDRVVWNFPHAGKGITDQDRNILSNQLLLLGFLRSVKAFLTLGPVPNIVPTKKRKSESKGGSESEQEFDENFDEDGLMEGSSSQAGSSNASGRGTVLITLRNVPPYTEWDLPKLAKKPPPPAVQASNAPNPVYIQLRSFAFRRSDWPGYEHRMTKGERAHGAGTTGVGGEDRTWEFCLRDSDGRWP